MTRMIFFLPMLCLAACSSEPEQRAVDDGLEAKGEILGGTISDDMLPLEAVRSQSPQIADAPETDAPAERSDPQPAPAAEPEAPQPSSADPVSSSDNETES